MNLLQQITCFLFGATFGVLFTHQQMKDNVQIVEKEVEVEVIKKQDCFPDNVFKPGYILVKEPIAEPLLEDADDHREEIQLPHVANLNQEQIENLLIAKEVGKEFNLSRTAMGIMYQESLAGIMPPVGDTQLPVGQRSYGLMQVRLMALKDAIRFNPDLGPFLTDEEMIYRLLNDKEYNVQAGVSYFRWLESRGLSWREALTAYNRGFTTMKRMDNPDDWHYTTSIAEHITTGPVAQLGNKDLE